MVWQQVIYTGNESPGHPIWPVSGRIPIGALTLQRKIDGDVMPFTWLPWRAFSGEMPETRGAALLIETANKLHIFNYEMGEVDWWNHAEDETRFEELKQRFHIC
ncbi:hypothetical protein ACFLWW_03755 [Chloroflexota bacterium]